MRRCRLPLTAPGVVDRVYTDLAVVDPTPEGFLVAEILPGLGRDDLQAQTGAPLTFAADCGELIVPEL